MSPLEIILILIGIVVIIISGRLVDRSAGGKAPLPVKIDMEEAFRGDELKLFKERLREQLSELKEETMIRTDDELSRLSNEKIMAVSDYSDQILEKIKNNHEEVVFLYNMLSEKEKELKSSLLTIEASRKKVLTAQPEITEPKEQSTRKVTGIQQVQNQRVKAPEAPAPKEKKIVQPAAVTGDQETNSNSHILDLYSKGKSIIEISKLLGLGQGEVKLVIDLFRGRK